MSGSRNTPAYPIQLTPVPNRVYSSRFDLTGAARRLAKRLPRVEAKSLELRVHFPADVSPCETFSTRTTEGVSMMDIEDGPDPDKRYWKDGLYQDHPGDALGTAILGAHDSYFSILLAIEQLALDLRDRARTERSVARKAIVQRHKAINGADAKVRTSMRILYVRARLFGLELTWKEVVYSEARTRGAASRRWLKDVGSMRKSGVDLRHVTSGAHVDEIDLLVQHEMEAREIRHLWKQAKKAEMQLSTLGRRVLKRLDEAASDDA